MLQKSLPAILLSGLIILSGCQFDAQARNTDHFTDRSKSQNNVQDVKALQAAGSGGGRNDSADTSFLLAASGDVLSHITNTEAALQPNGSYDYMPQLAEVKGLLAQADYTMVNLESTVAGKRFGYRGFPRFNAPVNLAQTLKKLGVDLVATANNHAMDSGLEGLKANLDNLDKIGLDHVGTYRTPEEAERAYIRNINGIKVGFVASSYGTNGIPLPNDHAVNGNTPQKIRAEIAEARSQGAEMIVYHIHWGKEYTAYPSQKQMDVYRVLAEEGVDIVIGGHPHRLQPMELREIKYQGETKKQAVIWSTGNLLQGQTKGKDYINTGSVFKIRVERRDGKIQIRQPEYDLVYCLRWKNAKGREEYRVIPEHDVARYKKDHPGEYEKMKREFAWAKKTLDQKVNVVYSDKTRSH